MARIVLIPSLHTIFSCGGKLEPVTATHVRLISLVGAVALAIGLVTAGTAFGQATPTPTTSASPSPGTTGSASPASQTTTTPVPSAGLSLSTQQGAAGTSI